MTQLFRSDDLSGMTPGEILRARTGSGVSVSALTGDWKLFSEQYSEVAEAILVDQSVEVLVPPHALDGMRSKWFADQSRIVVSGTQLPVAPGSLDTRNASHREALAVFHGLFLHDLAHAAFSKWDSGDLSSSLALVASSLEDVRIEHRMVETRPAARLWLRAAAPVRIGDVTRSAATTRSPELSTLVAAVEVLGRLLGGVLDRSSTLKAVTDFSETFTPEALEIILDVLSLVKTVPDTDKTTMLELSGRLLALVEPSAPEDDASSGAPGSESGAASESSSDEGTSGADKSSSGAEGEKDSSSTKSSSATSAKHDEDLCADCRAAKESGATDASGALDAAKGETKDSSSQDGDSEASPGTPDKNDTSGAESDTPTADASPDSSTAQPGTDDDSASPTSGTDKSETPAGPESQDGPAAEGASSEPDSGEGESGTEPGQGAGTEPGNTDGGDTPGGTEGAASGDSGTPSCAGCGASLGEGEGSGEGQGEGSGAEGSGDGESSGAGSDPAESSPGSGTPSSPATSAPADAGSPGAASGTAPAAPLSREALLEGMTPKEIADLASSMLGATASAVGELTKAADKADTSEGTPAFDGTVDALVDALRDKMKKEKPAPAKSRSTRVESVEETLDPDDDLTDYEGAHGFGYGGTLRYAERKPKSHERISRTRLTARLRQVQHRDRTLVEVNSVLPPGRLHSREVIKGSAERALGRPVTARPWRGRHHKSVPTPHLRVAVLCDVSGSMGGVVSAVASSMWVTASAVVDTGGTSVGIAFGDRADVIVDKSYKAPTDVATFPADGGMEAIYDALVLANERLDLDNKKTTGNSPRIVVIVSDGHWVDAAQNKAANIELKRLMRQGVRIIHVGMGSRPMKHPGHVTTVLKKASDIDTVVADACRKALADA